MSGNPYQSPETFGESPPPVQTRSASGVLVKVLLALAAVVIVVGLLFPMRRTARPAARRAQCGNNLKQIALALIQYEVEYHALPPAYTVDADGKPLHSWRTLILPYLEQRALFERIDLSKPWDDPANSLARDTVIPCYQCPAAGLKPGQTNYFAVVGPHACFQATAPRPLSEITDEHGLTLMVAEVDAPQAVHWMSPRSPQFNTLSKPGGATERPHPGGGMGVFVDGAVQFLDAGLSDETTRAIISIDAGDDEVARRGLR